MASALCRPLPPLSTLEPTAVMSETRIVTIAMTTRSSMSVKPRVRVAAAWRSFRDLVLAVVRTVVDLFPGVCRRRGRGRGPAVIGLWAFQSLYEETGPDDATLGKEHALGQIAVAFPTSWVFAV